MWLHRLGQPAGHGAVSNGQGAALKEGRRGGEQRIVELTTLLESVRSNLRSMLCTYLKCLGGGQGCSVVF